MAESVGLGADHFGEAWRAGYAARATGPLEPSVRTVCSGLGLADEHVSALIDGRIDFTRTTLVPRDGAVEVLDELRRRGYRLGLISVCSEEVPQLWPETAVAARIDEP